MLKTPLIGRLNHVGLAVPDLAEAIARYERLGLVTGEPIAVPAFGVTVAFIDLPNAAIELLTPLGDTSPLTGFLDRHPAGGMHHVCYEVADLRDARGRLVADGFRPSGEPRIGARGHPVMFLHPKDLMGTLVELEEITGDRP